MTLILQVLSSYIEKMKTKYSIVQKLKLVMHDWSQIIILSKSSFKYNI